MRFASLRTSAIGDVGERLVEDRGVERGRGARETDESVGHRAVADAAAGVDGVAELRGDEAAGAGVEGDLARLGEAAFQ